MKNEQIKKLIVTGKVVVEYDFTENVREMMLDDSLTFNEIEDHIKKCIAESMSNCDLSDSIIVTISEA
jgi:hypothetical protein